MLKEKQIKEYKENMQLSYITITNYRSITNAYKLDLSDLTVLLGKNNMGKTNIIRAINLGMDVLNNMDILHRRKHVMRQMYDWNEDFPITLQKSKKLKNKTTTIRMDFTLSDKETYEFQQEIHSSINGDLSIYIEIDEENTIKVTVPKKGKNARSMTTQIVAISDFLCDRFGIQYIPAVRSENDAYRSIVNLVDDELSSIQDDKYQEALAYIDAVQKDCLESLSTKVKMPLKIFLPEIRSIDLYKSFEPKFVTNSYRQKVEIDIDDGVRTSLSNKGDGVKSLVTIAMLSQLSTSGQRLIIVDEPENHLHPEAIHYIDTVLQKLSSNHQVLISTHNPIFVNRNSITSNLIVDGGCVKKAKRIEDIRQSLGVVCSDNLIDADYVIVVEGASDKEIITKCIKEDDELNTYYMNKSLVVQDIGGTHNLQREVFLLQQLCCNYLILLDYDSAGKSAKSELVNNLSIPEDKIRFLIKGNKKDTELEDLFKSDVYREELEKYGISLETNIMKNIALKWSDRVSKACTEIGKEFSKTFEAELKQKLSESVVKLPIRDSLTDEGYNLIMSIRDKVKREITYMIKASNN